MSAKQRIGYSPESAVLFENATGQELLELSGRLHDVAEERLQNRVRDILAMFWAWFRRKLEPSIEKWG
jgi:ABC-type multidrug transport system ATPase subunit